MPIQHRLATPVIQPRMRFFDKEGKPLVGGKVYAFKVGTEEFKPTYRNSELTALNQNPIVLDNAGSALIYLRGANQLRIYDKEGKHIENRIEYQQLERAQFYDDYGEPLKNGFVYTYDYQSTIKKTSYSIDDVTNPNPIALDENGTALVNIVGAYRLRQYNSKNVFVGDQDFKRPPIKVLTSVVYPIFSIEELQVGFNVNNPVIKPSPYSQENIALGFSVLNVYRPETVRYGNTVIQDDISLGFNVLNIYRPQVVRYGNISTQDNLALGFDVKNPKRVKVVGYINYFEKDEIEVGFNVLNPKRGG